MFIKKLFLILLFVSLSETDFPRNVPAKTTLPKVLLKSYTNSSTTKIINSNVSTTQIPIVTPEDASSIDITAEEIKNEVFVNDLLETADEPAVVTISEVHQGPHYELSWDFIDKDTIRVTFDLFSIPESLMENKIHSQSDEDKSNLLATMTTMPSRALNAIDSLEYFIFIIRPYHKNREIILKLDKLSMKNTTARPYYHFSNSLRLTSLNHHEKYSVCICYYQMNSSIKTPDLLLCQDIINDYSKFGHLKTDPKHGLLFITTQYSIIIGLLVVLQSVFTMRKRRFAHFIGHHLVTTAHNIRSTLSSVNLGRQSFSSFDTTGEHQQHATNSHATRRESTVSREVGIKKRIISSPAIVISEPSAPMENEPITADETEPFLKQVPSRNHVHFALGAGEGSDEDDNEHGNEDIETNTTFNIQPESIRREPYDDQGDALLYMAHILDTNKPWSRHSQDTSPV